MQEAINKAREAFQRGDQIFQYQQFVKHPKSDPFQTEITETLNSIANEGWELVNGSVVRDEGSLTKFTRGYYLFRRINA